MSIRRIGIVVLVVAAWLGLGGTAVAQYQPPGPGPEGPTIVTPPPVTPPIVPVVAPTEVSRPPAVAPAEVEREAPAEIAPEVLAEDVSRRFAVTGSDVTLPAVAAALALLAVGSVAVLSARRRPPVLA